MIEAINGQAHAADWPVARLQDVCDINPGRRAGLRVAPEDPVSFIPMAAVDARTGSIADRIERPFAEVAKGFTYFEDGDVIFAKITPCMQNGKHAICADLRGGFGFGSTEFHVLRPRPALLAGWLHYFLRQPGFLSVAQEHFTGTVGQQRLPDGYLAEVEIPLPPISEQRRLVERLNNQFLFTDTARRAAEERLAAAEALSSAMLGEIFDLEASPSWRKVRLAEVLVRHNEVIHPGDREVGEAPFVGLEHIESNTGHRIGATTIELGALSGRKPTFLRGQIVYGYLRPYLNKVWIAEFDGCSSVDQFAFEVKHEIADVDFVAAFMRSRVFLRRAQGVTTTGQLPRISIGEILAVAIDLPPLVDQRRIAGGLATKLETATTISKLCRTEFRDMENLSASLLRAAFNTRN